MTHNKFQVDDKKLLMRKICQLHFASSVNSLILVTIATRNFYPCGVFWTTGGTGPGDFQQLKKRRHQLFKQQILLPLYHWHARRIILPARPIIVSKVLVRTLVFCFIGFIKSKCRPIQWKKIVILILLNHWSFDALFADWSCTEGSLFNWTLPQWDVIPRNVFNDWNCLGRTFTK